MSAANPFNPADYDFSTPEGRQRTHDELKRWFDEHYKAWSDVHTSGQKLLQTRYQALHDYLANPNTPDTAERRLAFDRDFSKDDADATYHAALADLANARFMQLAEIVFEHWDERFGPDGLGPIDGDELSHRFNDLLAQRQTGDESLSRDADA